MEPGGTMMERMAILDHPESLPAQNRRISSPRILLITSTCLLILSSALAIMFLRGFIYNCDTQNDDVCFTPECIVEAATTLEYINTDVNPCDDFYKFSCGNYLRAKRIPDNEILISVLSDIDDKYREQLRAIIDYKIFPSNQTPFSVLDTFYQNCMNKNGIEQIGLGTISTIFKDLGGWPVVEGDLWKTDLNWIDTISKLIKKGFSVDYFFQFGSGFNFTNTNQLLFYIDEPKLGLSGSFLKKGFNETFVNAYYKYMTDVAVIFGANKTRAENEMREVMELHMKLAQSFVESEGIRNLTTYHNPMTIEEIEKKYGQFWNEYFEKTVREGFSSKKDEVITVYHPSYLDKLQNIIQETSDRTLANFIFWKSIESVVKYLPNSIREAELNFKVVREGISEKTPRWKECIDNSIEFLDPIVTYVYHQTFFNETILKETITAPTRNLVNQIHQEFLKMLEKIDWMDDETRQRALEKAKAMGVHIADEHKVRSLESLQKRYKHLELKSDGDYLQSYLSIPKTDQEAIISHLDHVENQEDNIMDSQTVEGPALLNPVYGLFHNQIFIPAGILQDPFMNEKRPQYINYATIGFVVGHEITHGFGDQGHQFDKNGNLHDWWDRTTKEQFLAKTNCLVYQYGNYSCHEIGENLNGFMSLGENMADNGGLKVAYVAYENWVKENGPEKKLPGLKYTPLQLFWIKLAQTWCIKYRPQILKELVVNDQHSPEEFRIRGSFSNSPEFAKDFHCPAGSKMNPVKKCSVW